MTRKCFYDCLTVVNICRFLVYLRAVATSFVNFISFWFPHIDLVIWQLLDELGVSWRHQGHVVSDVIIDSQCIIQNLLLLIALIIHGVFVLLHLVDLAHVHAGVLGWDSGLGGV